MHSKPTYPTASDYYPFGVVMSERSWSDGYRYGFNGKEKDDDVHGIQNTYDYQNRFYDSRLGRWFSIDPLFRKYESLSPYSMSSDNPLTVIDIDGKDIIDIIIRKADWVQDGSTNLLVVSGEFTVKVKVFNASSQKVDMSQYAADMQSHLTKELSDDRGNPRSAYFSVTDNKDFANGTFFKDKKMMDFAVAATFKINVEVEVVNSLDELKNEDSAVILTDYIINNSGAKDVDGYHFGNGVSLVETSDKAYDRWLKIGCHEEGHDIGMSDNYKWGREGKVTDPGRGMMGAGNDYSISDKDISDIYVGVLRTNWTSCMFGKGDGNKVYEKDKEPRKTEAKKTLQQHAKKK